jgi:hypothetical protein
MESEFTKFWLETYDTMANADTIDARVESDRDIGIGTRENEQGEEHERR